MSAGRGASRTTCPARPRARSRGFTYVAVLVLLAVVGLASALTMEVAQAAAARERERELDGVGREMAGALRADARAAPAGAPRYPHRLEDLLKDPRVPFTRRFLRRVYVDPMTGRAEWGTVAAPEGGIAGVYSLAGTAGEHVGASSPEDAPPARVVDRVYGDLP